MKTPKIIIVFVAITFSFMPFLNAQRFSYVDTEYILEKMPEYKSAQKQLDDLADQWKKEIDGKVKEVDKLYKQYQAEQVLLPQEVRKKREEEILQKEDELNKYKESKFGKEGELFVKRKDLVKPIQDKVFDAIQKLAKEEDMDFIFDKSGAVTMLYSNAKYDRSDEILEMMGVTKTEK
jgi:outer membrane protein